MTLDYLWELYVLGFDTSVVISLVLLFGWACIEDDRKVRDYVLMGVIFLFMSCLSWIFVLMVLYALLKTLRLVYLEVRKRKMRKRQRHVS
jgi:ABC-type dipeptide/oligopeptide/nickel transport system permease component